jgi:hypothetical protein
MQTLRLGATGAEVIALQRALNQRAAARRLPRINADGELGPQTANSVVRVGRALGAAEATLSKIRTHGVSVGLQRIIRWPGSRTPVQLARAAARKRAAAKSPATGQRKALDWARGALGVTEDPPGSNRGPRITAWQTALGPWLVGAPWCGVFVGTALGYAGVKGITSRVAAVGFIYEDARNGRNGFARLVEKTGGQPGDAVGLFGLSTHVGLIEKRVPGGYVTLEGNTSAGAGGSQSNGGGVFRRFRPYSAVAYVARPRWSA